MLKVNTLLTGACTVLLLLLGFLGRELYLEMRVTHDAILSMSIRMVNHSEFDVVVTEIKNRQSVIDARQSVIEARQATLDLEIQKMKLNK